MFIKFINFILSPWWIKDPYSNYYFNKKKTVGYTLYELVSILWVIPLYFISFGLIISDNKSRDNCLAMFLGFFYAVILIVILEITGLSDSIISMLLG